MATSTKAKAKKAHADEDPGVLFIRNVPPALTAALDARVAELKSQNSLYAGLSRSTLALNLLENAAKEWSKK
jgi:hypothetical protein